MKNKREDRFEAIVDQFVKNDLIAQEEYSYYLYGVKHLEVLIMTTGGVLLSGILLKEILFTVVFLITFSLLRIGWQGIHAKTKIRCFCYSLLLFLSGIYVKKQVVRSIDLFSQAVFMGSMLIILLLTALWKYKIDGKLNEFGDLSRPIQSVTTMYESPYMMSVGMFLFLYLIVKMAVCYVIILGMIWIAQKSETPSGAMIGIGAVGIAEYMLSAFLPSVSYADVFKYVNLAEYMKVYPLFSKYHNLDFFDNPVNAMTVFRIVLPVVLVLFVLGNVRRFFRCAKTKRRWRRERKNSSRIGFISDKLYFYESVKCLFSNRAIWVCIAVMYGAVLVGNSIPTYRDIKEEYYKFYMTDQQGKMTEEKVEYFNEERKRFEEIYSMTPENSDLTAVEIVQKQEENKYAHEGFSEAYSQVMYIMSNNQGKGVNEQELVYEKGYQLLFGDKAVKERLIGILLCVIAAVYSASGVLGTEYDLKVMNLLRSTKRGRKELFLKKLGVSFGITAVIFVLVKIPAILKVVGEYPLECWGAKVRSMMFAGQSVINCSIFGYVLMLMIMQLVTLFVIVFSTMALSVVLKDSTMTMILSLLLFGGPLLIEWGGVPIVHYLSLNSLLDGHQILQGNWLVLISEIVIFWGALSFAAGYVLYRAYENRR